MKHCFYIVLFTIVTGSCSDKTKDLIAPVIKPDPAVNPNDLSLTLLKDEIHADGVTFSEFQLKLGPTLAKVQEATFSIAPIGKFNTGNTTQKISVDVNGEARVFAYANAPGIATVHVTVSHYSKQANVRFITAYPDQVLISPDSVIVSALPGTRIGVKASLLRISGQATAGQSITFYDSTEKSTSVGSFFNTSLSDVTGRVTTDYFIQDTSYHGYVYIKGYVLAGDKKISGMNKIRLK